MADMKKVKNGLKEAGDVANAIAGIGAALVVLQPLVSEATDTIKGKVDERKNLIVIPELYSKGLPIKLERAIILLEEFGLKVEPVQVRKIDVKYKECFDLQVVGSKPKQKQKVKLGSLVFLKYVTSETIEGSQKMFDEAEKCKAESALEKSEKRSEQKEKRNKIVTSVMSTVRQTTENVTLNAKRILIQRDKKDSSKEGDS